MTAQHSDVEEEWTHAHPEHYVGKVRQWLPQLYPDEDVPATFVRGCLGDLDEARKRWLATAQWRKAERVDSILDEPQPNFAMIKKFYPHAIHRCTRTGHWVYIERPGQADMSALWKAGLSLKDIERHYTFIMEFLFRCVETRPDAQILTIFDASKFAVTDLSGKNLNMIKKCTGLAGAHYPERTRQVFITNVPWYAMASWSLILPFLDPNTAKKVVVTGKDVFKALKGFIDEDELPVELGGTDEFEFGDSPVERDLRAHVQAVNARAGLPFDASFCVPLPEKGPCTEGTTPYASGVKSAVV